MPEPTFRRATAADLPEISTSRVALDVVTTPVTTVDGSPILIVSSPSALQSTPMFFLMRSTISCTVTAATARAGPSVSTNGAAAALAAVIATKSRLDMDVIRLSW